MALKVVSSYTPVKLKVTTNPAMQGSTINPQKTVSPQVTRSPMPQTVSPQRTVTAQRLQPTAAQITTQQALAYKAEQDRIETAKNVQRKRLADAMNNEIKSVAGGIKNKLWDKASLGTLRRQRGGRELAVKYYEENEKVWGYQLMARQRNYENKGAQLKDWVMQSTSEAEYNQRVKTANAWLDKEYNEIDADIKDFTATQTQLANYSETPLKGKAATLGRGFKNTVSNVTGKSLGALIWTASQLQRGVNTGKNFVNPNNLRLYYGGDEKKGGLEGQGSNPFKVSANQLRKSYNASANQRTFGLSKADEAERIANTRKRQLARYGKDDHGFLRGTGLAELRIKYGDDIADMLSDPMNFIPGAGAAKNAGKATKTDKLLAFAGKNSKLKSLILSGQAGLHMFQGSKVGKGLKKLNEEFVPRGQRAKQAIATLNDQLGDVSKSYQAEKRALYQKFGREKGTNNKILSEFITKQTSHAKRLNADLQGFEVQAKQLADDYVKRLQDFSDREVRAITKYARNGEWSRADRMAIDKYRRADLVKFLDDYQSKARTLAKSEGLKNTTKTYLPEFSGRGYDPTKRRTLFGDKYYGQTREELQKSLIMREFVSNWDESNDYLKQLSATEKAILRNAKKTGRGLSAMENEQIALIKSRKEALEKLGGRYGQKFDAIRGAMDQTRQAARPAIKIGRGGVQTTFTKQALKNTAADVFHLPMKIWKKSVLKYNPAWYVNNAAWNVPASVSAAGADVFSEYGKLLTNKQYWNEARKAVPEGVMSKISQEIGKGGLASKIEDTSRLATFLALKKKGFTDEQALKQVNRWLFDYGTKNWERPIKGVLPFWQWQKNIIRLGATMPFHSPRSAKIYSEGYKAFYQRPYENLPDEVQTYTDPDTGKEIKYNPRQAYKGKAKIGNSFYGLPFFAVNPDTAMQFGTNPYLATAADYVTSTDRFENKNTDRKPWTIAAERFPQANLGRALANRNNKDMDLWFSESGNSKWAQGWNQSKSNYKMGLDNNRKFYNTLKSFVGMPRGVKFDQTEFDTKKRLTDFNKKFFEVDWAAKEDANYKQAQKEKEALAKQYGFDLQKDIYDGYWSKYDTATTKRTKTLKRDAAKFNSPDSGYWSDYFKLPKGSKTSSSKRRPFLIGKFDEWKRDHTFAKNAYYKLPKKGEINPFTLRNQENQSQVRRATGKRKYARKLAYEYGKRTGDWSRLNALGGSAGHSSPYKFDGKFFKSQDSMDRYKKGKAKHETGKLWEQYFDLPRSKRPDFLKDHPKLRKFETPKTQAEWDALKLKIRTERNAKLDSLSGFTATRKAFEAKAEAGKPRLSFGYARKVKYKF